MTPPESKGEPERVTLYRRIDPQPPEPWEELPSRPFDRAKIIGNPRYEVYGHHSIQHCVEVDERLAAAEEERDRLTNGAWIDDAACHDRDCSYRFEMGRITDFERIQADLAAAEARIRELKAALNRIADDDFPETPGTATAFRDLARAAVGEDG